MANSGSIVISAPVTLVAMVSPASSTGKVTFYDGSAILGIARLSNGQASLVTRELAYGKRHLTAIYSGDSAYTRSVSAVVQVSVSTSAGGAFVAGATLGTALYNPKTAAVTDLNHDGYPDLVITSPFAPSTPGLAVCLGNGDGTFQAPQSYLNGVAVYDAAVGDFDLDGTLDLVMTTPSGVVSMRGNGDGTFGTVSIIVAATLYSTDANVVRVADFNYDGVPDLLLLRPTVEILLGNGDGTFQTQSPQSLGVATAPSAILIADLNGDGLLDLSLAFREANYVTTMLGVVGGGFSAPVSITSYGPITLVAGDLNGDGTPDLVIGTNIYPSLDVALNRGDGTFAPVTTLLLFPGPPVSDWASGSGSANLMVYDFNGDGLPDIVSASAYADISVNLGRGDGTFQPVLNLVTGPVVGDLNLDGIPDAVAGGSRVYLGRLAPTLTMTASPSSVLLGQSVTLTVNSNFPDATGTISFANNYDLQGKTAPLVNGVATLTYTPSTLLTGGEVAANYSGDLKYPPTQVSPAYFRLLQTAGILLSVSSSTVGVGQPITLTATITGSIGNATVSFYDGAAVINTQTLYSQVATYTTLLTPGVHHLTAGFPGNQSVVPASSSVTVTVTTAGGGQLLSGSTYSTSTTPTQVLAQDFNHDNILDLATLDPGNKEIVVLMGKPNGAFDPPVITPLSFVPGAMVQSIGGYAVQALAITDPQDNAIIVLGYYNNGSFAVGTPLPVPGVKVGTQPVAIATADFDGDGSPDYVTANAGSNDVSVIPYSGINFYLHLPNIPAGKHPSAVVAEDFNHDGKADFAVANRDDNTVMTFLGNGDDTFHVPVTTSVGSAPAIMITGDVNGDGAADLVLFETGASDIRILLGNGDGTFLKKATYPISSPASAMVLADLNADGKADLAVTTAAGVLVFNSNGDGTFGTPTTFPQFPGGTGIAAGPFSGIGRMDLAITRPGLNSLSLLTNTVATAVSFTGAPSTASLSQAVTLTARVTPANAVGGVAFFDNGIPAGGAAITNGSGTFTTSLLLPGPHSFTARFAGVAGFASSSVDTPLNITVTSTPTVGLSGPVVQTPALFPAGWLATADLNKDGILDLVSFWLGGGFRLEIGNGDGTFQEVVNSSFIGSGQGLVADFNDDGNSDILAGIISLGDGKGGFTTTNGGAGSSKPVSLADFNRDGRVDIAFIPQSYSTNLGVAVALGTGDGNTFAPRYYAVPDTNTSSVIATGDFNEDGKTDIIAADPGPSNGNGILNVLLGNGDATFGTPLTSLITPQPQSVVTADFNRDGHLDVALVDWSFNTASILLGKGDGTFLAPTTIALAGSPRQIVAADMNGDGNPDLVILFQYNTPAFAVLNGNGDGTFAAAVNYPTLSTPYSIAVGDVNRDGRMDVVLGHSSGLSVYPGATSAISISRGANQSALISAAFPIPLAVNAPPGTLVTFDAPVMAPPLSNSTTFAAGTFAGGTTSVTVTADASGVAQAPIFTANSITGSYIVIAAARGVAGILSFPLTNIPGAPAVLSLSPLNGSGNSTFVATVSDSASYQDIGLVYFLFNRVLTTRYGCMIAYDNTNNFLLLYNDAGTGIMSGTITPGSTGTLANSRCQISGVGASVTKSGNNLTVAVPVVFLNGFVGTNTEYINVSTKFQLSSGWMAEGTWTGGTDTAPTIAPNQFTASGNGSRFSFTFADSTSGENIALAYAFFGANLVLNNNCVIAYSAGLNVVYLLNDSGTGVAGFFTPGPTGAGGVANSQCFVYNAGAVTVSGANLTLPVNILASASFGGLKTAWGYALNTAYVSSALVQIGMWAVTPNVAPGTITMTAPTGSGNGPYNLQASYSDPNGYLDLADTTLLVTSDGTAVNACGVVYAPAYNAAFLLDDAGTGYVPGFVTLGVVGTPISNTHCSLQNAAPAGKNGNTTLKVPLQLTFTNFTGMKTIYGQAFDSSEAVSPFQTLGTLTLP